MKYTKYYSLFMAIALLSGCGEPQKQDMGDYSPEVDAILNEFPTADTTVTTALSQNFKDNELLKFMVNSTASNYKKSSQFNEFVKEKSFENLSKYSAITIKPTYAMRLMDNDSNKLLELYQSLLENCNYFVNDDNFKDLLIDSNPKQTGLAYNWGSKFYNKKTMPAKYAKQPNVCSMPIYGLDCSGLIYQVFLRSGLNFGNNPRNFANAQYFSVPKNYKKVLDSYFGCENCYIVERINNAKAADIRSGDILLFEVGKEIKHIGICFKNINAFSQTEPIVLYESRGNPALSCTSNMIKERGPKCTYINKENRLKSNKIIYHIIRIKIK